MTNDVLTIECSQTVKNILCEALLNYAQFSDQSAASHPVPCDPQQIQSLVEDINQQFNHSGTHINLQRTHHDFCARAIHYHYDRIYYLLNTNVDQQRFLMLNMLNGQPAQDADLDRALVQDCVV